MLIGGDNRRCVRRCEWIAETKRWTPHCWDLQYCMSWEIKCYQRHCNKYLHLPHVTVSYTTFVQLLRSAVWLLIYWTKYHASQFVIVPKKHSSYALGYTVDRVPQVPTLERTSSLHVNWLRTLYCLTSTIWQILYRWLFKMSKLTWQWFANYVMLLLCY